MKLANGITLKMKLMLMMLATTGLALGIACSAFVAVDYVVYRRAITMHIERLADVIGSNCSAALAFQDDEAAADELQALSSDPRILSACLYDQVRRPIGGYQCTGGAMAPSDAVSRRPVIRAGVIDVWRPIYLEEELIGIVNVRASLKMIEDRLREYSGIVVGLVALAMMTSLILTLRLQKLVSDPILKLARLARRVSTDRDYSLRAEKTEEDEIGSLVDSFNDMLAQIQKRDQELEISRRTLEKRVDERTQELQSEIAERERADVALRESEKKYRDLIESSQGLIFAVDAEGRWTFVNSAVRSIYGYAPEEMIGHSFTEFVHPDRLDSDLREFQRAMKGEYVSQYETTHVRKDGAPVHLSFTGRAVMDEKGVVIGATGTAVDVTERRRAEARERDLQDRLARAERLESLGILAGGVAHDLNNMLGPLVGYPDMILEQLPPDSSLREDVIQIRDSAKRSAAVIQDLLALARRGNLQTTQVQINKVIEDFVKSPQLRDLQANHPGVDFKLGVAARLPMIRASPSHMMQVIQNLVINAYEACTNGGRVSLSTTTAYLDAPLRGYESIAKGDYVVLQVSDTGDGISPDDLNRIFEPFYTKKKMGRSGTGLGLAVVYGVVRDFEGYIDVRTSPGRGTDFSIYLPVAKENARPEVAAAKDIRGKESVLVIDDVPEQRALAQRLLGSLGYAVETVSSGREALDFLHQRKSDVLVLDMIMDEHMDGLDTYREVVKIRPGQRCVVVTGFSENDRVKEVLALGAGSYVTKPYTRDGLGGAGRQVLDQPGNGHGGTGGLTGSGHGI